MICTTHQALFGW